MTLTDLLVPTYRNLLRTLLGLLDKAEAQLGGPQAEALLSARLAPDMFPLATQLRFACVQAQEGPLRLLGALLDPTQAVLDTLAPDALDQAPGDDPMELTLPIGLTFDLTREQFARDWALGQFYFHVMAAYAILRANGVEIGKADYVPHMFAYVRPAAAPVG